MSTTVKNKKVHATKGKQGNRNKKVKNSKSYLLKEHFVNLLFIIPGPSWRVFHDVTVSLDGMVFEPSARLTAVMNLEIPYAKRVEDMDELQLEYVEEFVKRSKKKFNYCFTIIKDNEYALKEHPGDEVATIGAESPFREVVNSMFKNVFEKGAAEDQDTSIFSPRYWDSIDDAVRCIRDKKEKPSIFNKVMPPSSKDLVLKFNYSTSE
jgi:hypothetical protein